jgi:hypothetical protein
MDHAKDIEAIGHGDPEIIRLIDSSTGRPDHEALSAAFESFQFDGFEWLIRERFSPLLASRRETLPKIAAETETVCTVLFLICHVLETDFQGILSCVSV